MGWVHKPGRQPYYRVSWREGGRIVQKYYSAGEAAWLAAEEDQDRRRRKRQQRQLERIDLIRLRGMDELMEDYCRRVGSLLESSLEQAGYRRHNRGAWRKTRRPVSARKDQATMAEETEQTLPPAENELAAGNDAPAGCDAAEGHDAPAGKDMSVGEDASAGNAPKLSPEEIQIILRARQGDESARAGMREIVARYGTRGIRPLAEMVRDDLLEQVCDESIAMYEDIRHQMENLRRELAGPASSPLEQLLADRVALCWLHVHYFELRWSHNMERESTKRSEYYQHCLESAHRRYLASIRSLAQVRRLQLPSLQLNLASQQINVADRQLNLPPAFPEDAAC